MEEKIIIRKKKNNEDEELIDIYNSFSKDSFAVYTEELVGASLIDDLNKSANIFLVVEINNIVVGFGSIKPYRAFKSFNHVGVLTYFIKKEFTGKGLGTSLFNKLISEGIKIGIENYLAHISSYNNQSLNFHKKQGFKEVGRFKNMFFKFGKSIDIVWVQKDYTEILEKE